MDQLTTESMGMRMGGAPDRFRARLMKGGFEGPNSLQEGTANEPAEKKNAPKAAEYGSHARK
ncbi:MAG: hypothetical protein V1736_02130 [Pseudomonadota bacterium]